MFGGANRSRLHELMLLAATLLIWLSLPGGLLLVEPVIGMADNADFDRLLCPAGLDHPADRGYADRYFYYINRHFDLVERESCSPYISSASITLLAARALHDRFVPDGQPFDIRLTGGLNVLLMALAMLLLLSATRALFPRGRWLLLALLTLFFADVGYIVYLNSFYGEAATLIYFFFTAGVFLVLLGRLKRPEARGGGLTRPLLLLALLIAGCAFALSKPQNYILVFCQLILLAPLFVWLPRRRERWLLGLGTPLLIVLTLLPMRDMDPIFTRMQIHDIVFVDLLPHTEDPAAELEALGLPPEMIRWVGQAAWAEGSPLLEPEFGAQLDELSYGDLGRYYLSRPKELLADLHRAAEIALDLRVRSTFGHYEQISGQPPRSQSGAFDLWSVLRERLLPGSLTLLTLLAALNLLVLILKWRRYDADILSRGVTFLHAWVLAVGIAAFVTTALAEGSLAPRHFFLVNLCLDACLLLMLIHATQAFRHKARTRFESAPFAKHRRRTGGGRP